MPLLERLGITLSGWEPLLDGRVPPLVGEEHLPDGVEWMLEQGGTIRMTMANEGDVARIDIAAEGLAASPLSLGVRVQAAGVARYLRNGYHSWDGSFFAEPGAAAGDAPPGKEATLGFAMTALVPQAGWGALMLGSERHDRFQTRFRFGGGTQSMQIDAETLLDRTGTMQAESLFLFADEDVEASLRRWSARVAAASPLAPRLPDRRITGWCSWYNLYASITENNIIEQLAAARQYSDAHDVALDVFLIDDGFTPEMGDWLDVKPQFPRGMGPLLGEIAAAGFTPGLWIAPFMVGNRSRLYADHPDWVVQDRHTGGPLVQMEFYGEFRWHKRSEEYYILDITHPGAEAWMRQVFRTWARDWGARYFKTDFMFFGAEYGPDRAQWHEASLSRIAIWRRMAMLIREEIGEALWLGCGCPLWASVGLVDGIRIGRDVGVKWAGEQSAESLLRDQASRNHASGILWQADPDCIMLRDAFHYLSDAQLEGLALLAGLSGGVLMTSDTLDRLPAHRAALFAALARLEVSQNRFPSLGREAAVIEQRTTLRDGRELTLRLNPETGDYQCHDQDGSAWP